MSLARELLAELDDDDLAELAARLEPHLGKRDADQDAWLTTPQAAAHLGISVNALHRLTGQREIPFHQQRPNGRCYFRRAELDDWRQRPAAPDQGGVNPPRNGRRPVA